MKTIIVAAILLLATTQAHALTVYQYVGNPFQQNIVPPYTALSHLTMNFVTASPLSPNSFFTNLSPQPSLQVLSFAISDGINTITNADNDIAAEVRTDALGNIIQWLMDTWACPPQGTYVTGDFLVQNAHHEPGHR